MTERAKEIDKIIENILGGDKSNFVSECLMHTMKEFPTFGELLYYSTFKNTLICLNIEFQVFEGMKEKDTFLVTIEISYNPSGKTPNPCIYATEDKIPYKAISKKLRKDIRAYVKDAIIYTNNKIIFGEKK